MAKKKSSTKQALREQLAGLAMQALIAKHPPGTLPARRYDFRAYIARGSVLYADALIKELERTK